MNTLRIFIGFDSRETVAYHVLCQSILARSSRPVSFTPIALKNLEGVFQRETHPLQSTQFSFSRFLVPWMSGYEGWSLFMDCDMICREDIARLFECCDENYAVMVAKHVHIPREETKFLGAKQSKYEKKNWSSVMLFNNAKCRALTPEYVNTATGLELHQFKWLEGDHLIGEFDKKWNHLVDYNEPNPNAAIVHYTLGGPYFEAYKGCEFSREWEEEFQEMTRVMEKGLA